jgi:hypothetical protein
MLTILVDQHLHGQAVLIQGTLVARGWLDLLSLHLVTFEMEQSKSGVYVCDCGVNIAATINVPVVVKLALQTPVK